MLYRKLGEAYYDQSKYEEAMQEFLKAQEKIQGEWESKGYLNICNAKHTIAGLGNLSAEEMANAAKGAFRVFNNDHADIYGL